MKGAWKKSYPADAMAGKTPEKGNNANISLLGGSEARPEFQKSR
jgi:hypothetical protein